MNVGDFLLDRQLGFFTASIDHYKYELMMKYIIMEPNGRLHLSFSLSHFTINQLTVIFFPQFAITGKINMNACWCAYAHATVDFWVSPIASVLGLPTENIEHCVSTHVK